MWTDVLGESVVLVAIISLLGVVITQAMVGWSKKKQHTLDLRNLEHEIDNSNKSQELESLKTTVDVLKTDYQRLVVEINELRNEIDQAREFHSLCKEKYSVSLGYVGSLLASATALFNRLDREGILHASVPDVPPIIEEDLLRSWPAVRKYVQGL